MADNTYFSTAKTIELDSDDIELLDEILNAKYRSCLCHEESTIELLADKCGIELKY